MVPGIGVLLRLKYFFPIKNSYPLSLLSLLLRVDLCPVPVKYVPVRNKTFVTFVKTEIKGAGAKSRRRRRRKFGAGGLYIAS